jgi:hypothetical protein
VIFGKRRIAVVEELAGDRMSALWSGGNLGILRHPKGTKLGAKSSRELGLQSQHSPSQVSDLEEAVYVYLTALIDVFPVHVRQTRCRHTHAGAGYHPVLDRHVIQMVVFDICGRFDLD